MNNKIMTVDTPTHIHVDIHVRLLSLIRIDVCCNESTTLVLTVSCKSFTGIKIGKMADYARARALVPTLVSLATFAANIPVIFVTFRSRRFENDSVAKVIASLAVSDIGSGIFVAACCAGVAWSFQPGEEAPEWLLRVINSGMYTFGKCSMLTPIDR